MQSKLSRASSLTGMSTEINRVHLVMKECKTMWRTKCEDFKGDVGCHLLFQYWKAIFVVSVIILALLFMTNNQPKTEHCYAVQTVLCDLLRFEHFRCPSSSHMFVCVCVCAVQSPPKIETLNTLNFEFAPFVSAYVASHLEKSFYSTGSFIPYRPRLFRLQLTFISVTD